MSISAPLTSLMVNRRLFEGPGFSDGVDDKSAVVAEEEMKVPYVDSPQLLKFDSPRP
eukprot:SAG11_NODE_11156_length_780_cov_1.132159_1_plen_56_part_01